MFDAEIELFNAAREELLQHHAGKFALIRGSKLADVYDSAEHAYEIGLTRWGNTPFLVKQILADVPREYSPALTNGLTNARV